MNETAERTQAQATITRIDSGFRIAFPYDPALVAAVKRVPGRRFCRDTKSWTVPANAPAAAAALEFAASHDAVVEDAAATQLRGLIFEAEASIEHSRAKDADIEIPVPDGLEYLPYQRAGIAYGLARPSTLIADEMGLGKTIQAIGICNADPDARSILIICPDSLKLNWRREWERWDTKGLSVAVANGKFPSADVCIINYDILRKHRAAIRSRSWDLLVVDEAHYIKNGKAQRTAEVLGKWNKDAAKRLAAIEAKRRIFLTGTPIVNRPAEAWILVHSLAPDVFGSWFSYMTRYAAAHRTRWGWDTSGASHLDELQEKLRASIMVRRLKKDVLTELPPKRRQVIELPAAGLESVVRHEHEVWQRQQDSLEALRVRVELAKASENAAEYEAAVSALRQGEMAAFTELSRLRHETALAKLPQVIAHLQDSVEQGKVVCFCHHKDVVAAILAEFPDAVSITGDTPMQVRQDAVDRFQSDESCRLFVGNIQAAGVGLTLTASSHVIFAELDWVPGNVSQAEDRCHRLTQVNSVLVQHLVLEGSLDATMARVIAAKQDVIDRALDVRSETEKADAPAIQTMDSESIEALQESWRNANESARECATKSVSRQRIQKESESITADQTKVVHAALISLAGMRDGAEAEDYCGFNKVDALIGHSLAMTQELTPRQAALGRKIARKYHRQIGGKVTLKAMGL